MAVQEKDLLNIIFDDGSQPGERANAVSILKSITKQDRDALVNRFSQTAKRKRSPPRERPRPQDARRIKELEEQLDSIPSLVVNFFAWRSTFDLIRPLEILADTLFKVVMFGLSVWLISLIIIAVK